MAVNENGGFSWAKTAVNSPIIVNVTAQEYYKQPHFYIMGHFSKFIPPGSVRIGHTVNKDVNDLQSLTVVRPDGATVLVVANYGNNDNNLVIHDPQFGNIAKRIEAHSIQSYIWWP